jgi:hypothetical protein
VALDCHNRTVRRWILWELETAHRAFSMRAQLGVNFVDECDPRLE